MKNQECATFRDELAALIEIARDRTPDQPAISDELLDHLADCDECRDARHEALLIAEALAVAGADYVHPEDMTRRVLAALDSEPADSELAESEPAQDVAQGEAVNEPAADTQDEPEPAADTGDEPEPADQAASTPVQARSGPDTSARPANDNRAIYWLAAAAVIVGVGGLGIARLTGKPAEPAAPTDQMARQGTSARLDVVDRAADDDRAGVMVRAPGAKEFVPLVRDAAIAAGSTLRTDERTRARMTLDEGSVITLDHGSEVTFSAESSRHVTLRGGELVAEVVTLASEREGVPPATFVTPSARVEVLGTRFALTAQDDFTSVRVSRGLVRLHDSSGQSLEVRPGEEGTVAAGKAPEVAPVVNLAESMSWSERLGGFAPEMAEGDSAMAGIGELRAFKPGEKRDRDWAMALARHHVTVRIAGNVARTEIEETFRNDSDATLEGVYRFPLPPDARIDRLALDVDGGFEEGAFVAKERAARIWAGVIEKAAPRKSKTLPEIIWVPGPWRDPALLEWQRGGRFELRVFPIPARGTRTVKIGYTQTIRPHGDRRRYVYPLAHATNAKSQVETFDIDVRVSGADPDTPVETYGYAFDRVRDQGAVQPAHQTGDQHGSQHISHLAMSESQFTPRGNIIVEYALPRPQTELRAWTFRGDVAAAPQDTPAGNRARELGLDPEVMAEQRKVAADSRPTVLFAIKPRLPRWTEARPRDYIVVVDSSQSMVGERVARATRLVSAMVAEMDRRDRFTVLSCDIECQAMQQGALLAPSSARVHEVNAWLAAIEPAGASDIVAMLGRAAQYAKDRRADRDTWVLYVGDGMASMGHRRPAALADLVATLARDAGVSISTVGIGADADATALSAIARAGRGHFVPYTPGESLGQAALAVLETTYGVSLQNPEITLPAGISDVAPGALATLRAGDELLVAGRFTGAIRGNVVLRGTVGGKPYVNEFPVELEASTAQGNGFVPRTWAALMIDALEQRGRGEDRKRIIALSTAYGVLSRHTSLLVLESEAMFRAFGVDRSAPTVRWTGEEEADMVASQGLIDYDKADSAGAAVAQSAPAPATKSASSRGAASKPSDDFDSGFAGDEMAPPRRERSSRGGRGGQWMRRAWYRVGTASAFDAVHPNILAAVASAEAALAAAPHSREAHRALVQALSYAGQLDRAYQVASQWLERDRLDPEALVYMADILGRQGHRDRSLRLLSGVVDIEPDNEDLHARLALAYDRIGAADRACAHRVSLAELASKDDPGASQRKSKERIEAIAQALRCQRGLGRARGADLTLLGLSGDSTRAQAEAAAAVPARHEQVKGELLLEASWTGGADIDITVVTPQGTRLSWMGGRTSVRGDSAADLGRERLALDKITRGNYLIEVSRARAGDATPVAGHIQVNVLGTRETLPFALAGDRAVVGRVAVRGAFRLVPM
jgi:ferric-dicitrate binding protein FerR (iron transport regulator)/tetratricopeptide (TPR) repeat protein